MLFASMICAATADAAWHHQPSSQQTNKHLAKFIMCPIWLVIFLIFVLFIPKHEPLKRRRRNRNENYSILALFVYDESSYRVYQEL